MNNALRMEPVLEKGNYIVRNTKEKFYQLYPKRLRDLARSTKYACRIIAVGDPWKETDFWDIPYLGVSRILTHANLTHDRRWLFRIECDILHLYPGGNASAVQINVQAYHGRFAA